MPSATPIPPGPSVLTLYAAADMLTGPGCPVCRYAGEASERYLAWFALEGHADAVTTTRLCSSLGMCPRHTRGLMSQPGAPARLTAVYRYVMGAARDQLGGRGARLSTCPACEHDHGAERRALDTLLEGLADDVVRERYRVLGGLCIPHFRMASTRGGRRVVTWLSETMTVTVTARPPGPGWLAGIDRDADVRAVLRQATHDSARPGSHGCVACWASGRAEYGRLAGMLRSGDRGHRDRRLLLCDGHLSDVIVLAGEQDAGPLLAWQAGCLTAGLAGRPMLPLSRQRGEPAAWLRLPRRRAEGTGGCPVCLASEDVARRAVGDVRTALRAPQTAPDRKAPLCVRHLLGLRALDPRAGCVAAPHAVQRADTLIGELDEAFGKDMWAHRHESRGPEMTAWRRAAAFLDASVFCGCPQREA